MFFLLLILGAIVVAAVLALVELSQPTPGPAETSVRVIRRTGPETRLIWNVSHTNRVLKARGVR